MDDGGPTATAFLLIFIVMILMDVLCYGFGAAIENLKPDDLNKNGDKDEDNPSPLREREKKTAKKLEQILEFPGRYINTIQLLTLLINMIFGVIYIRELSSITYGLLSRHISNITLLNIISYGIAFVLLMYIILTIGVLIPRKLGARYPEKWAYFGVGAISMIITVFSPFTGLVRLTAMGILRLFGFHWDADDNDVTEEEIKSMVSEGQEQGVLQDSEADMISNIFEFSDKQAQDIMTNRKAMVCIDGNTTLKEAVNFMLDMNNSRFPVYLDNIDHIIGILHIRDAMKKLSEHTDDDTPLRKTRGLLRSPRNVPETRNIDSLFHDMQKSKTQMVIVIDEYGQTAGLVSMEDIIEEIVGNIMDEYDEDEDYIEATSNEDEFIIEGKTPLEDLEDRFGIEFEDANFETVNGLLISKLDRIPEEGEDFTAEIEGYSFKILSVKNHMIQSVLVKRIKEEKSEEAEDDQENKEN
ncbi:MULTISPECIES: hemolysin family protein [unclassified Butyrivibrio]|uniref:hemolysin family protein n=1 Tax=unclassified Butyrivibrio TaxID=2639466 RepID=UPI0003B3AB32|nr:MULTISPECIES: hemolysin family protein [unclassified Butyrivibrio]